MTLKKKTVDYYMFYCPGCKHEHTYAVCFNGSEWYFNGNMENPSFTPSLLNVEYGLNEKTGKMDINIEKSRCHLFVTDGKIVYCGDCTHELSGQTVDLIDR